MSHLAGLKYLIKVGILVKNVTASSLWLC